jgi:hypothetical protein
MSRIVRILPLLLVSLVTLACADAAKHLRAQPAWFLEPKETLKANLPLLDDVTGKPTKDAPAVVEIKCVREPRRRNTAPSENESVDQCLYLSMDMNQMLQLPIHNKFERNQFVHLMVNVSDFNCGTFLMRAFANKTGTEATRNTAKDVTTAIAAGTAPFAAPIASGLGLINLVGGTAIDNVNLAFYADKTFQVMSAAIGSERSKALGVVLDNSKADIGEYSFLQALQDLQTYDDACSLRRGLDNLVATASADKSKKQEELNQKRNAALVASDRSRVNAATSAVTADAGHQ